MELSIAICRPGFSWDFDFQKWFSTIAPPHLNYIWAIDWVIHISWAETTICSSYLCSPCMSVTIYVYDTFLRRSKANYVIISIFLFRVNFVSCFLDQLWPVGPLRNFYMVQPSVCLFVCSSFCSSVNMRTLCNEMSEWLQIWYINTLDQTLEFFF